MLKEWRGVEECALATIGGEISNLLERPAVIILSGVVGAGKTSFVKSFTEQGVTPSPTYSVINEFSNIVHADFYRLKSKEEIIHLELDLYSEGKDFILIEWGLDFLDEISSFLTVEQFSYYHLEFEIVDSKSRNIKLSTLQV